MAFSAGFMARHPRLASEGYEIASPNDESYNCVAWALGRTDVWFEAGGWKGTYWPDGMRSDGTLDAYLELFESLGYVPTESPDYQPGQPCMAIYSDDDGEFCHVALRTESGWTSKCGELHDIFHATLEALEDQAYGRVVKVLRRDAER